MKWLKITKYYRGGSSVMYVNLHDPTIQEVIQVESGENFNPIKRIGKQVQESIAKDFAERMRGGDNYGYSVYWKIVYDIPKKELKKLKEEAKRSVEYAESRLETTKEHLKFISSIT